MASINLGDSKSGRRKSLDAELNLVPFIDLLSMCIAFLLLTAAWISVGALQVKQSHGTDAVVKSTQQYDIQVQFVSASDLKLEIKRGKTMMKRNLKAATAEDLILQLDSALAQWPETKEPTQISSVKFKSKATVTYGDLVNTMDVFRKHQILNLAVVTGAAS